LFGGISDIAVAFVVRRAERSVANPTSPPIPGLAGLLIGIIKLSRRASDDAAARP
jgi:hypothetical protein